MTKIDIDFDESGYPYWITLKSNGDEITLQHDHLPDLIFQLQKIADRIKMKEEIAHQRDLGRAFRGE